MSITSLQLIERPKRKHVWKSKIADDIVCDMARCIRPQR